MQPQLSKPDSRQPLFNGNLTKETCFGTNLMNFTKMFFRTDFINFTKKFFSARKSKQAQVFGDSSFFQHCRQGDQMSLKKIAQNVSQPIFVKINAKLINAKR
jgi:hypothetical protein